MSLTTLWITNHFSILTGFVGTWCHNLAQAFPPLYHHHFKAFNTHIHKLQAKWWLIVERRSPNTSSVCSTSSSSWVSIPLKDFECKFIRLSSRSATQKEKKFFIPFFFLWRGENKRKNFLSVPFSFPYCEKMSKSIFDRSNNAQICSCNFFVAVIVSVNLKPIS